MKKIILIISLVFCSFSSQAAETTGVIEKLRVCGTGESGSDWKRTLQFRINGIWFGTYADYYNFTATDFDNDLATSIVFLAYSQKKPVSIKATHPWSHRFTPCGISSGHVFHSNSGDFIELE